MRLTACFGTVELGVNYSKLTPKIKPQALTVSFSAQRSQSGGSSASVAAKAPSLQANFGTKHLNINISPPIARQISGDVYDGDYEVTPGQSAVVLTTVGKAMARNVTVNPIPSNYGLITWNGSTLTVS